MPDLIKAYRFRLEPRQQEREDMQSFADCCRFVWNWALQQRNDTLHVTREIPAENRTAALSACNWIAQCAQLKHLRKQFIFLEVAPLHALQQVIRDLDRAWQGFMSGRLGHPHYRRKGKQDSFKESDVARIHVNDRAVRIPKLGWIKYRNSRALWWRSVVIRQLTVSRDGDEWYFSVSVACSVNSENFVLNNIPVGIDLGITQALTVVRVDGQSEVHHLPMASDHERTRMIFLQRRVNRTQTGSCNRAKASRRCARLRRRLSRRVHDKIHTLTTNLANNHSKVIIEDLHVRAMTRSGRGTVENPGSRVRSKAGLNRAILERCWGEVRRQLVYKCQWSGANLLVVSATNTSRRCSECGHTEAGNRRSQGSFQCLRCNHAENADINAARNILGAGLALAACGAPQGGVESGTCFGVTAQLGAHQKSHFVRSGRKSNVHDSVVRTRDG